MRTGWLASCIAALVAFGLIVRNIQAVWDSPDMTVPKRDIFRLVSDYEAVNSQAEQSPGGDAKPGRYAGVVGGDVLLEAGFAPVLLADAVGSGRARGLHHRHA